MTQRVSLHPLQCCFGDEFAKQATTTVEQVKAMKKLHEHSLRVERSFFRLPPPKLPKQPRGGAKSGVQDTSPIKGGEPDRPIQTEQPRTKDLKLVENCVNCQKEIIICQRGNSNKFACWPNQRVQRELGPANTESMGTVDCSGVSATPHRPTGSDTGPQKGWRPPTSSELEGPKQIHSRGAFQGGGLSHGEGSGKTRGFDGQTRFERCLFSGAGRPQSPEVPSISMEGQSVPVSLPTIWPILHPSHLHKVNETSGCFP